MGKERRQTGKPCHATFLRYRITMSGRKEDDLPPKPGQF